MGGLDAFVSPRALSRTARGQVKDKQQNDVMSIRKQDGGRVWGSRAEDGSAGKRVRGDILINHGGPHACMRALAL